jgi:hypothetical protein
MANMASPTMIKPIKGAMALGVCRWNMLDWGEERAIVRVKVP